MRGGVASFASKQKLVTESPVVDSYKLILSSKLFVTESPLYEGPTFVVIQGPPLDNYLPCIAISGVYPETAICVYTLPVRIDFSVILCIIIDSNSLAFSPS